jgi:hypothetical protein
MDHGFSYKDVARILRAVLEQAQRAANDSRIPAHGRCAYAHGWEQAMRAVAQELGIDPRFVLTADAEGEGASVLDAASCRWARAHCLSQEPGRRAECGARC